MMRTMVRIQDRRKAPSQITAPNGVGCCPHIVPRGEAIAGAAGGSSKPPQFSEAMRSTTKWVSREARTTAMIPSVASRRRGHRLLAA